MPNQNLKPNTIITCLNCNGKINTSDQYCQSCGQKIKSYKLSIWLLIKEVFSSIFNLETKFVQTMMHIWRPAFLTRAYVAGERKRFVNPGRFFIITFFILSAVFSYMIKVNLDEANNFDEMKGLYAYAHKQEMLNDFDTLTKQYILMPAENIDSLREALFFSKEQLNKDSISAAPSLISAQVGGIHVNTDPENRKIAAEDIHNLSKEELYEKYEVVGFINKLLFIQYIKFKKDPRSWVLFIVTNSLWTIVLSTFVLAFIMKILYIRRSYYFVEHLVFWMTSQSFMFLLLVLLILAGLWDVHFVKSVAPYLISGAAFWLVWCIKDYYRQSWFKTIAKAFIISLIQTNVLVIFLLLVGLISAMLY